MNYEIQSKKIKPGSKSCNWCKHFNKNLECSLRSIEQGYLTHRLVLKLYKENEFRYCKNYKYSSENFKKWKKEREKNFKETILLW